MWQKSGAVQDAQAVRQENKVLTNFHFLHILIKVEYIKAMTEKSKFLEDKREKLSPAESSFDWKKTQVHS